MPEGNATSTQFLSQSLLLSVAEELKLPLLQLSRQLELSETTQQLDFSMLQATTETAMNLLDNYVLGLRLSLEPQHFMPEPVSISSVLYDVGQHLDQLAKNYGVNLELHISGRYVPVVANRQGLQAALTSLGAALIEAAPANADRQLRLQLATHRCRYGIVAGLYSDMPQLTNETLQRGRRLMHSSRQPLMDITHTSGAGVFVADSILRAMDLKLRASRHHRLYGLGTVMQSTNQLQLV